MSQKKKQSGKIIVAVLLGIVAVAALTGIVVAKYVADNRRAAEIHASGFHFSSDYLEPDGGSLDVSDWDIQGITFHLYNYEKENVAQISDTAMDYRITVPAGWQVSSVKDDRGNRVDSVNGIYTMAKNDACFAHTVTVKYVGSGRPDSVGISVSSVSPYEKELKATFRLTSQSNPTFTVTDCGGAVCLTVFSNNYAGPVLVKWPQGKASPDNVNSDVDMSAWLNENASGGESFTAEAHHIYTLYFMKNNDAEIPESEFAVERGR